MKSAMASISDGLNTGSFVSQGRSVMTAHRHSSRERKGGVLRAPNLQSRQMGFAVKPFDQNQIHIGHQRERLRQIHGARIEQGCSVRSGKHHSGDSGAAIAVGVASVLIHGSEWWVCLTTPTRSLLPVSRGISHSINVVFPESDHPAMQTAFMGIAPLK